MKRRYYSLRTGKNPNGAQVDLKTLKALFYSRYRQWEEQGFFQEHFGYYCVDADFVAGALGNDIGAAMLFQLRKEHLWPITEKFETYSEEDLFDLVEFFHDHISRPVAGVHHSYSNCGYHYHTFDAATGQQEFRARLNELLETYKGGYELSPAGEILERAPVGTDSLLSAPVLTTDVNVSERVDSAIAKFRRYRSTIAERRDAIRDLADVLEYLRPSLKSVLDKSDDGDLFNIANNFGIRHHNQQQKTNYDSSIWLSWMFYFYLATIHAALRLIDKQEKESGSARGPNR